MPDDREPPTLDWVLHKLLPHDDCSIAIHGVFEGEEYVWSVILAERVRANAGTLSPINFDATCMVKAESPHLQLAVERATTLWEERYGDD
jgi:hypothetical protein